MAKPLGSAADAREPGGRPRLVGTGLQAQKKKGCKQSKCSKWKGGKCRCGRD
jgi:hypothetical protein